MHAELGQAWIFDVFNWKYVFVTSSSDVKTFWAGSIKPGLFPIKSGSRVTASKRKNTHYTIRYWWGDLYVSKLVMKHLPPTKFQEIVPWCKNFLDELHFGMTYILMRSEKNICWKVENWKILMPVEKKFRTHFML